MPIVGKGITFGDVESVTDVITATHHHPGVPHMPTTPDTLGVCADGTRLNLCVKALADVADGDVLVFGMPDANNRFTRVADTAAARWADGLLMTGEHTYIDPAHSPQVLVVDDRPTDAEVAHALRVKLDGYFPLRSPNDVEGADADRDRAALYLELAEYAFPAVP